MGYKCISPGLLALIFMVKIDMVSRLVLPKTLSRQVLFNLGPSHFHAGTSQKRYFIELLEAAGFTRYAIPTQPLVMVIKIESPGLKKV